MPPETDRKVWLDLTAGELCYNHTGSTLRIARGPSSIEGKLVAVYIANHEDHGHIKMILDGDEETTVEAECDPDIAVQLLVGEES